MQLVLGDKVTTKTDKLPTDFVSSWQMFKTSVPGAGLSDEEKRRRPSRVSDVLTEACVVLATTYSNHIVENFQGRVFVFLKHKIQSTFPVSMTFTTFCRVMAYEITSFRT
jgi:hypothetical protein